MQESWIPWGERSGIRTILQGGFQAEQISKEISLGMFIVEIALLLSLNQMAAGEATSIPVETGNR